MEQKKKILITVICSCIGLGIITAGTLATFSDSSQTSIAANTSNLKISVNEPTLSNADNISPGDCDPTLTGDRVSGKEHKLTFSVSNDGTTAVKTRQIIEIKTKNDLDASVFFLTKDKNEIPNSKKYYITQSGEVLASAYNGIDKVDTVKYVIMSSVLDGSTDIIHTEEIKTDNCSYDLGMSYLAENEYQNTNISIAIEVQALQYQNTVDSDWNTLFSTEINGSVST